SPGRRVHDASVPAEPFEANARVARLGLFQQSFDARGVRGVASLDAVHDFGTKGPKRLDAVTGVEHICVDDHVACEDDDGENRRDDEVYPELRSGAHDAPVANRYPTPRTVWMWMGRPGFSSIFFRSRLM